MAWYILETYSIIFCYICPGSSMYFLLPAFLYKPTILLPAIILNNFENELYRKLG